MARIYRCSDRIKVKIDDLTVTIAPLTVHQKTEIQEAMANGRIKRDLSALTRGMFLSLKYAVKSVSGLEDVDGKPYSVELDEFGCLSDACVNDLFNIESTEKLALVCTSLMNGIPDAFTDNDGKKLEGVEVIKSNSEASNSSPNP